MKILKTGITIKLEPKEREVIAEALDLLSDICDELGADKEKVTGWSCSYEEVAEAHDRLLELWLHHDNDRDYDFKTIS